MSQRSIRFPDELERLIEEKAVADDRSFSYVVLRALESALGGPPHSATPSGEKGPGSAASSRAPVIPEDLDAFSQGETPSRADRFRNARTK